MPWSNRAKMTDQWPSNLDGQYDAGLGFVFPWLNTSSHSVVLDVWAFVALNGVCSIGADSSFWGGNHIYMRVITFLQASLIPSPVYAGAAADVAELSADDGGFLGLGEVVTDNVSGSPIMNVPNFIVPAGKTAAFQAGLHVTAVADGDCFGNVDFVSGDFQVLCPYVQLVFV